MKKDIYKRRVIAFIDILGMSDEVLKVKTCKQVKDILEFFSSMSKHTKIDKRDVSIISDTIVLSCDFEEFEPILELVFRGSGITHRDNERISSFLLDIAHLQFDCLYKFDILLRGAITIGDIYQNEKYVFGDGLSRAHKLEKKAIYPRIIIDNSIATLYAKLTYSENDKCPPFVSYDDDGKYYIDYIDKFSKNHLPHLTENYDFNLYRRKIKNKIDYGLNKFNIIGIENENDKSSASSIREKYLWLQKKYTQLNLNLD